MLKKNGARGASYVEDNFETSSTQDNARSTSAKFFFSKNSMYFGFLALGRSNCIILWSFVLRFLKVEIVRNFMCWLIYGLDKTLGQIEL